MALLMLGVEDLATMVKLTTRIYSVPLSLRSAAGRGGGGGGGRRSHSHTEVTGGQTICLTHTRSITLTKGSQ